MNESHLHDSKKIQFHWIKQKQTKTTVKMKIDHSVSLNTIGYLSELKEINQEKVKIKHF